MQKLLVVLFLLFLAHKLPARFSCQEVMNNQVLINGPSFSPAAHGQNARNHLFDHFRALLDFEVIVGSRFKWSPNPPMKFFRVEDLLYALFGKDFGELISMTDVEVLQRLLSSKYQGDPIAEVAPMNINMQKYIYLQYPVLRDFAQSIKDLDSPAELSQALAALKKETGPRLFILMPHSSLALF